MYKGIAASRGIGIGSICRLVEHDLSFEAKVVSDTAAEKDRFRKAIDSFVEETNAMADEIRKNIGPKEAEILLGHAVMISDPAMSGEMFKMIEAGQCAETALTAVCDMFIGMFSQMEDEMMRQRAADIMDVKVCILKKLLGIRDIDISKVAQGTVLVCKDLTPSMTSQIVKENVSGIITEVGGPTSHSAILARALEIPAVLSVPGIVDAVEDKDIAVIDGTEGEVFINPDGEPFSPDGVTDWFSNLSKKYDLPHIHPHAFRHSVASALIFSGVDTVSVAGTLGHASPTTTEKIYAHFIDAAEKKNEEILSNVYGVK